MTDFVIAIHYGKQLTYYRDKGGRYYSNAIGLDRAERFPTIEAAKRVVAAQFPGHRKRISVLSVPTARMLAGEVVPSGEAVPPQGIPT
jgi:hypothetical protein